MRAMGWGFAALVLASCGGGSGSEADPAQPPATATIEVYKSRNATQCGNDALPLDVLQGQLTAAGVAVGAAMCGNDGVPRLALCGLPNGAIAIFEIDASRQAAAQAAGFAPLSTLPSAVKQACA